MDNIKNRIKPKGNLISSRGWEITIGLALFLVGSLLLWDAFDGRGKKLPYPISAVTPW